MAGGLCEQDFKHQQPRSHHNRAVGHIEGRPLVWANIEEEKIHDVPADQAVPQIADRAAQNQRQADSGGGQAVAVFPEQEGDDQQRNYRKQNQQADFPFGGRIRKNTKRRARVFSVNNAKKSWDDRNAVMQGKAVRDRPLGGTIESDDERRDQKMIFAHDPEKLLVFLSYFASRKFAT